MWRWGISTKPSRWEGSSSATAALLLNTLFRKQRREDTHRCDLKRKRNVPLIQTMPLHPLRDVKCLRGTLEEVLRKECGDYVSVTLTDEKLPYQPREQLNRVFPYLLEVKIDNTRTKRQLASLEEPELMESPLEMFGRFYKEIHGTDWSNEEQKIVKEILEKLEVDQ